MEYVLLGDDVSDGVFAWINVGIDATEDSDVTPAAHYTEDGGVENENSGMGMGGGSPPGSSFTASARPSHISAYALRNLSCHSKIFRIG